MGGSGGSAGSGLPSLVVVGGVEIFGTGIDIGLVPGGTPIRNSPIWAAISFGVKGNAELPPPEERDMFARETGGETTKLDVDGSWTACWVDHFMHSNRRTTNYVGIDYVKNAWLVFAVDDWLVWNFLN
jgi:hypothetical protein